jgi:hypothetical protein
MSADREMTYFAKFGIDLSQFISGLSQGQTAFLSWYRDITVSLNMTMQIFQIFEQVGVQAFNNTVGAAIAYQDTIENLHNTLGVTNADAQKWRATAIATDTDINSLSTTMRYLVQRVSDTGTEGENLRGTLKGIGVDAYDSNGKLKDTSTLYLEILEALNSIPAGSQRSAAAANILGRNWYTVAEMIEDADAAVKTFKESQPLFSDEELDNIDAANKKLGLFEEKLNAIGSKTGAKIVGDTTTNQLLDLMGNTGTGRYARFTEYNQDVNRPVMQTYDEWLAANPNSTIKDKTGGAGGRGGLGDMTGTGSNLPATQQSVLGPFAGLSQEDAQITYLRDYQIPALEKKYQNLAHIGTTTGDDLAKADLAVIEAKQSLIDLTTKETEAQKTLTEKMIEMGIAGTLSLKDIKYAWDNGNISVQQYNEAVIGIRKSFSDTITSAKENLADIDKSFSRNISTTSYRDVGKISTLIQQHQWDVEDQQTKISTAAKAAGITITGPIYLNGDKSFEKKMAEINRANGVSQI